MLLISSVRRFETWYSGFMETDEPLRRIPNQCPARPRSRKYRLHRRRLIGIGQDFDRRSTMGYIGARWSSSLSITFDSGLREHLSVSSFAASTRDQSHVRPAAALGQVEVVSQGGTDDRLVPSAFYNSVLDVFTQCAFPPTSEGELSAIHFSSSTISCDHLNEWT